jgi:hypothetical protein
MADEPLPELNNGLSGTDFGFFASEGIVFGGTCELPADGGPAGMAGTDDLGFPNKLLSCVLSWRFQPLLAGEFAGTGGSGGVAAGGGA